MTLVETGLKLLSKVTRLASRVQPMWLFPEAVRRLFGRYRHPIAVADFDSDIRITCYLNEHMGSHIFWRGAYSGDQLAMLDRLARPDHCFVDVGANLGEFTLFMAKRLTRGRVIAFEPSAKHFARLQDNIALNSFTNIDAVNLAVSDRSSRLPIFDSIALTTDGTFHEGLVTLFPAAGRREKIGDVDTISLDQYLDRANCTRVDCIKIDVEGAELAVLHGVARTLNRHRPAILLEINEETSAAAGYAVDEVYRYLSDELRYAFYSLRVPGRLAPVTRAQLLPYENVLVLPRESKLLL